MYNEQASAVFDMLQLQELQALLNYAIKHGEVVSFDDLVKEREKDPHAREYMNMLPVVFTPSKYDGYCSIVADCLVDGICHADIISTYNDIFESIDVYLSWYIDEDDNGNIQYYIDGLCIVPKDEDPNHEPAFYWSAPAKWPDDVKQPTRPQSTN